MELVDCLINKQTDAYVAWVSSTRVSIQIMYFKRKHARVLELAKIKRSETNLKNGTQASLLPVLVIH